MIAKNARKALKDIGDSAHVLTQHLFRDQFLSMHVADPRVRVPVSNHRIAPNHLVVNTLLKNSTGYAIRAIHTSVHSTSLLRAAVRPLIQSQAGNVSIIYP